MRDFQLHGNPGDYAWGRGGLDAIITQVLFRKTSTRHHVYLVSLFHPNTYLASVAEPHGWYWSPSYGQREHCRHSHSGNIERNARKEYILFRLLGGRLTSVLGC